VSLSNDHSFALTVLGGLLHDIGKLGWRGADTKNGCMHSHEYYSKEFVCKLPAPELEDGTKIDLVKLADIVYNHHNEFADLSPDIKHIIKFIKEGDRDASRSERESSSEESPRVPLQTVFNKICICEKRQAHSLKRSVYLPKKFAPNSIFPDDDPSPQELASASRSLWEELMRECAKLPPDIESYVETLTSLLKKYTFFTLSAGYKAQPTVPLFDHLKVTAACAAALYKYCEKSKMSPVGVEKPYSIIVGDISGIQNFIFDVHSPEASRKNAAKRLRGRSLEVQLIMDAAAKKFLERYDLPCCNLLWCTGGQFAILAPAYASDDYQKVAEEINLELWRKFGDILYIAIGAEKCSLESEDDFMKALRAAQHQSDQNKHRRFFEVLKGPESPLLFSKSRKPSGAISRCPLCWMDFVEGQGSKPEDRICSKCREQESLGRKLATAEYLFEGIIPGRDADFNFAGESFHLLSGSVETLLEGAKGTLYKLNDAQFMNGPTMRGVGRGYKFMAMTMPRQDSNVISFDILSQLSKGADKLGLAKGDVDNLGYIMHSGIIPAKIWSATNLSSLLDAFFAGYLNEILRRFSTYSICDECAKKLSQDDLIVVREKRDAEAGEGAIDFEHRFLKWWLLRDGKERLRIESVLCEGCRRSATSVIYINYSGGDDFLIIGPWDATLEALVEIRDEFDRFVSKHPDLGMSIGYVATDSKYPIAIAAKDLSSSLSRAKKYRGSANRNVPALHKKDMISALGDCVSLSDDLARGEGAYSFKELLGFGKRLEAGIENKMIPRGMVHDLINLWQGSFGDYPTPDGLEKARREVKRYMPMLKYMLKRNLAKAAMDEYDQAITDRMPWILIPASWALLRSRSRRD